MSTHPHPPTRHEPEAPDGDTGAPNPTGLPVEPEFGPALPQGEPEEPGTMPAPI